MAATSSPPPRPGRGRGFFLTVTRTAAGVGSALPAASTATTVKERAVPLARGANDAIAAAVKALRSGEKVLLRFINAGAMTYFDVRIPGLKMTVVAADGLPVHPVTVDEFRIAPAETFDVLVRPAGGRGAAPLASSTAVSLVLMWSSMVTQLKLTSLAS